MRGGFRFEMFDLFGNVGAVTLPGGGYSTHLYVSFTAI
jgi:hypothetical protein